MESSRSVMGAEGSRRPVSMKVWIVDRLRGVKSREKLEATPLVCGLVLCRVAGAWVDTEPVVG